jgi:RNA polymerase sigma factor (sigma-70 family)
VPDLQEYGSPLITPDSRLEELDKYHRVIDALQQLPPRRRAVMAFHYDGATHAEIAAALGIEPATVRSTYREAKADLAEILARAGLEHRLMNASWMRRGALLAVS